MKMRERAGEKEMWMLCKIFSLSLLKSLSFENFSSVALFLSLSLAFVDSIDLGRERERERKRAHAALASGCFLSSSFSSNWNVVTLISSLQSFSLCERTIFTTDDDM